MKRRSRERPRPTLRTDGTRTRSGQAACGEEAGGPDNPASGLREGATVIGVPFGIGITEMIILLLVLLVVFGPKRLPEMGRQLGKGMREFKDSVSGKDEPEETEDYDDVPEPTPAALPSADATTDETTSRERDTVS